MPKKQIAILMTDYPGISPKPDRCELAESNEIGQRDQTAASAGDSQEFAIADPVSRLWVQGSVRLSRFTGHGYEAIE